MIYELLAESFVRDETKKLCSEKGTQFFSIQFLRSIKKSHFEITKTLRFGLTILPKEYGIKADYK
jgi:hypothetical protein